MDEFNFLWDAISKTCGVGEWQVLEMRPKGFK